MAISAVLGALGAGMNLLSPLFSKRQHSEQINPLTDQRLQELMAAMSQYEPQFNRLGGEAESARGAQRTAAGKVSNLADKAEQTRGPSANAWFDQFLENVPEYQAVAEEVSRQATSRLGRDITERGRILQEQSIRAAQEATAGQGFSGAAAQAVGQAASAPIADASIQADQMAADIYNQTFQNLGGQGQNIAYQDQQMQFQNALTALAQAMQGQQIGANIQGNVGQQALGQQQNVGSYMSQLQSNIQDITQPVYSQGQTVNPLGDVGNSLGALGGFLGAMQGYGSNNYAVNWDDLQADPVKGRTGSTFGGR